MRLVSKHYFLLCSENLALWIYIIIVYLICILTAKTEEPDRQQGSKRKVGLFLFIN